jgi:hypothetical protein
MCAKHEAIGRYTSIPEYHSLQGKKITLAERVYLARYFDIDGPRHMSLSLERPLNNIYTQVQRMKKNGEWDLYRSLTEDEYEKIILAAEME